MITCCSSPQHVCNSVVNKLRLIRRTSVKLLGDLNYFHLYFSRRFWKKRQTVFKFNSVSSCVLFPQRSFFFLNTVIYYFPLVLLNPVFVLHGSVCGVISLIEGWHVSNESVLQCFQFFCNCWAESEPEQIQIWDPESSAESCNLEFWWESENLYRMPAHAIMLYTQLWLF